MDVATIEAIEQADSALTDDQKAALDFAIMEAATKYHTFSANEVWPLVPTDRMPSNLTSLGGRFLALAREGLIERQPMLAKSDRTHGSLIATWRRAR
jgi:hypothetical protein